MKNLAARLARQSEPGCGHHLGCVVWTGATDRDGYGRVRVTWPTTGRRKIERVARLAYMVKSEEDCLPSRQQVGPDGSAVTVEVSHLCHNRLCINPAHLHLEPKSVNAERRHCVKQNRCIRNHGGHPNCLIRV